MKNLTLRVKDIACPDCAQKIGQVLQRKQGVSQAEVSFMTGKLTLSYDEDKITLDEIKTTVGKLGYELAE
jgi:Cu+-exporting ATPase